eukprot:TRINITY_DN67910_c0_g1_i1.p1 TRINITY_DN67910_c0_g1~~TRINITY_DN67910_c0_g1_i1.p1  ORF type:complete len:381 (+),score=77.05 TRINITY_DN67910_c0_g1_i1:121-1143(+)
MMASKQLMLDEEILDDLDLPLSSTCLEDGSEVTVIHGTQVAAMHELRELGVLAKGNKIFRRTFVENAVRSKGKNRAGSERHARILELLFAAGATATDELLAIAARKTNYRAMEILIGAGAKPTVDCVHAISNPVQSVPEDRARCIRLLGSDFLAEKAGAMTRMIYANDVESCRILHEQGVPLKDLAWVAVHNHRHDIIRELGQKADRDDVNRAADFAVNTRQQAPTGHMVDALLSSGADPKLFHALKLAEKLARFGSTSGGISGWEVAHWTRVLEEGCVVYDPVPTAVRTFNVELLRALVPRTSKYVFKIALVQLGKLKSEGKAPHRAVELEFHLKKAVE